MEKAERKQLNIFSHQVKAGRRTYYFDVKATKSGDDFFVIITESRRIDDQKKEKQKIFLYKEDFRKFSTAITVAINHIEEKLNSATVAVSDLRN
ncbi:MAG: DUF3276 family protein [Ignavibacteriales bacterium]|nr:DUF3276 family protein [Ignavibacteriales bacterium]